jgi:glycosyltransferase involved in cell wall biosynthesis
VPHHHCFLTLGDLDRNASFVRLREFGNALADRGHRVSYVIDDYKYNHEKLQLHPRAEKHFVPDPRKPSQVTARRRVLKQLRPDYVHFLNPSIKSYLALVGTGLKFFCDWDEWPARRPHPFARGLMERYLDHWCRTRSVIRPVASKYLVGEFARLGNDAAYIPYAAYLQPHADGPSPFAQPTVVYVGNFYPAYDHDLIFEAARILKVERGETPAIAVLGGGPDFEKWQAFVRRHDLQNVHLPGYLTGDALWRHMRHARANLFPIRETLLNLARCPSKTFAYMQARRPVIACPVGEVKECLGDQGMFVPPDPTAWADAISAMMQPGDRPDIDYHVEAHNWSERTDRLLAALADAEQRIRA